MDDSIRSLKGFTLVTQQKTSGNQLTLTTSGHLDLPADLLKRLIPDLKRDDKVTAQLYTNPKTKEIALKFVKGKEADTAGLSVRGTKINLQKMVNAGGLKGVQMDVEFEANTEERAIFFKLPLQDS